MMATEVEERFYSDLWRSTRWGDSEPNADEAARWGEIRAIIETDMAGRLGRLRILDLGCGRGWLTKLLTRYGEVLGIDPTVASIERARELFPELRFRADSAEALLADGKEPPFDLIVSSEVIEHVPSSQKSSFLEQARELLGAESLLILTTPRGELWSRWSGRASGTQPVEEWVSEGELEALAGLCGLRVIARRRARPPRRPLTWHGHLLRELSARRVLKDLPLGSVKRWLAYRSAFYQVVALRRLQEPSSLPKSRKASGV